MEKLSVPKDETDIQITVYTEEIALNKYFAPQCLAWCFESCVAFSLTQFLPILMPFTPHIVNTSFCKYFLSRLVVLTRTHGTM